MSGWRANGGYLGPRPTGPSTSAASGWWDSRSQFRNRRDGQWPTNGDPYWANVSLLLPMNGTNGSTTFTDASSNALSVTAGGNAQISTAESKFGGASGLFDGTGDLLSFSTITLSGDFTAEAWIYKTARDASGYTVLLGAASVVTGQNHQLIFDYVVDNSVGIVIAGTVVVASAGTAITTNAWHHLAWTRAGSSIRIFVDGVQQGSTATSTATVQLARIGGFVGGGYEMNGNIADVRVTAGIARFTANFTPPSAPHPIG